MTYCPIYAQYVSLPVNCTLRHSTHSSSYFLSPPIQLSSTHPLSSPSAMSQPARLRSLYRSLLRELPPRPLSTPDARSPLHQKLRQSFSRDASRENDIAQVEQLIHYLKAQRQYTTLLERYHPGMDMEEEERIRLSARRVGMNLPKEYSKTEV